MNIDLNIDWLRKDIATPSVYYGYAQNAGSVDTDSVWAIRKVTTVAGVDSVLWNENRILTYSARWDERVACFATPSGSLGFTYSVSTRQNSFNITYSYLNMSWTDLSGTNLYRIKVSDQNGITYNALYDPFVNPWIINQLTTEIIGTTSYVFRGVPNMTYSVVITGVNALGVTSSSSTIRT